MEGRIFRLTHSFGNLVSSYMDLDVYLRRMAYDRLSAVTRFLVEPDRYEIRFQESQIEFQVGNKRV